MGERIANVIAGATSLLGAYFLAVDYGAGFGVITGAMAGAMIYAGIRPTTNDETRG